MGLLSELRRRNVLRMVVLYLVAAWLIMQVAEVLMSLVGLPLWSGQAILAVLAVGFPDRTRVLLVLRANARGHHSRKRC